MTHAIYCWLLLQIFLNLRFCAPGSHIPYQIKQENLLTRMIPDLLNLFNSKPYFFTFLPVNTVDFDFMIMLENWWGLKRQFTPKWSFCYHLLTLYGFLSSVDHKKGNVKQSNSPSHSLLLVYEKHALKVNGDWGCQPLTSPFVLHRIALLKCSKH